MDTLVSTDRCDKCQSQAYIRVNNDKGQQLDFCAHDYRKYSEALDSQGFTIVIDTRELLTRRPVGAESR